MYLQESTLFYLDTQNVAQYPLFNVTYASAKFEAATANSLEGDAFTRKIHYLTLILGPRSLKMLSVPSTSCDIYPCEVSCYIQQFRRICINLQEDTLGPRSHKMLPSTSCDLSTYKVWSCCVQQFKRCIYK